MSDFVLSRVQQFNAVHIQPPTAGNFALCHSVWQNTPVCFYMRHDSDNNQREWGGLVSHHIEVFLMKPDSSPWSPLALYVFSGPPRVFSSCIELCLIAHCLQENLSTCYIWVETLTKECGKNSSHCEMKLLYQCDDSAKWSFTVDECAVYNIFSVRSFLHFDFIRVLILMRV